MTTVAKSPICTFLAYVWVASLPELLATITKCRGLRLRVTFAAGLLTDSSTTGKVVAASRWPNKYTWNLKHERCNKG